ncbi:MAG: tRNA nucleotidyltransferase [Zetaproteobacteria bacterium CG_4_9_14_3_um_filter_53_7]|nr:MAG: tRNA nucleotidyltransferase [Zetaproteobacteria bacterium CG_4_9_14_3_um_filter_53_7]
MSSITVDTSTLPASLIEVCQRLAHTNAIAWLVGGCVRDLLLGITPKDFDLEVFNLPAESLEKALKKMGRVELVGKQFGVFKLWVDGLEIDVALPRTEQKTAQGHRGFLVNSEPYLSPEAAASRRDFTINAMMLNPLTGQILDFHNGKKDLSNKTLRHISHAFNEDPLRPLRAMQFASRFGLSLHQDTAALCHGLIGEASTLPRERVWAEWKKWSQGPYPSYGLQLLMDSGWITLYPELQALVGCPQDPHWHPEGDVWTHTLQCCDQAAAIASRNELQPLLRQRLVFATLCHDFGKPSVTATGQHGRIISPGHSEAGMMLANSFLSAIGAPASLSDHIGPLVREHITHLHSDPSDRAVRRLAHRLEPANIELWEMLVEADASGRAPAQPSRPALEWLKRATLLQHHQNQPRPILTGKLLIALGKDPGPTMGLILKAAYEAQLDGYIQDETSAVSWYNTYTQAH